MAVFVNREPAEERKRASPCKIRAARCSRFYMIGIRGERTYEIVFCIWNGQAGQINFDRLDYTFPSHEHSLLQHE